MELRDASRPALWLRRIKLAGLTARRLGRWLIDDELATPTRTFPHGAPAHRIAVPIARAGANLRLEAGKRRNVRLAATAFHGVELTPTRPLSFWRTLGPASEARGFAWGMELRSGCAVPAVGGGLCLVSNALFTLAVELGWLVLERHGHSIALESPTALDATVAFPHVDLRIAPRFGRAVLDVSVHGDVLVVGVHHAGPRLRVELERTQHDNGVARDTRIRRRVFSELAVVEDRVIVDDRQRISPLLRTCLDCGETACHARVELPDHTR